MIVTRGEVTEAVREVVGLVGTPAYDFRDITMLVAAYLRFTRLGWEFHRPEFRFTSPEGCCVRKAGDLWIYCCADGELEFTTLRELVQVLQGPPC